MQTVKIAGATLALLLFALFAKAQTDSLRIRLNYIFQNINKSIIPTSYLEEYGAGLVPLDVFNGQLTDSNRLDMDLWRYTYGSLYTSRIYGTNSILDLPTINSRLNSYTNYKTNVFTVPVALLNYSYMRADAVQQNLFTVSNNQLYDVAGRTQSPYVQRTLFIASPAKNWAGKGTVSFLFKSDLFITNTGKSVSSLSVDFANGSGYKTAAFNTPLSVTYTDTGYKRLKIKLVCTDNSIYQCYVEFNVLEGGTTTTSSTSSTGEVGIEQYEEPADIVRDFPATTNHSGGTATVRMSRKGTERQITKPLIVVEGYDVSDVAPFLRPDAYNYNLFLRDLNREPTPYNFNYQLDDVAGYDLIFLNYNRGTDDIRRNAALFEEVLQWVNANKVGTTQNVVLGISMGGLVARYGLARLTKAGTATQTRLLITHDSPHRGANTPLGFQYVTRFLNTLPPIGGFNIGTIPAIQQANQVLDEPASVQLLIWRATTRSAFAANTFLDNDYRNMVTFTTASPQPYKIIATSNGSECGVNTLTPGSNLLSAVGKYVISRPWIVRKTRLYLDATIKALPDGGSATPIATITLSARIRLFGGVIHFSKISVDLLNSSSPANTLPWDAVPGGTQPIRDNLPAGVPTRFEQFVAFNAFAGTLSIDAQLANRFCFVPVASALDVTNMTRPSLNASYINGVSSPSYISRMANFIAQEPRIENGQTVYNIIHPSFTARNAEWLYNEIEGITPNTRNCSSGCQPAGFAIFGTDLFCTSAVYDLNTASTALSTTWTSSPSGYVTIAPRTPNGSSADVTKVSSGNVTVTATVTGCGTTSSVSRTIHVGGYSSGDYPVTGPATAGCGQSVSYSTNTLPGATSYNWFWPSDWTYLGGQGTPYLSLQTPYASPSTGGYVGVRVANACDAGGSPGMKYTQLSCSGFYTLSPNPATDEVSVSVKEQASHTAITEVNIYDQQGNLRKHQKFGKVKKATLNISSLPTGIYIIEMGNGTTKERQQLSVRRQ